MQINVTAQDRTGAQALSWAPRYHLELNWLEAETDTVTQAANKEGPEGNLSKFSPHWDQMMFLFSWNRIAVFRYAAHCYLVSSCCCWISSSAVNPSLMRTKFQAISEENVSITLRPYNPSYSVRFFPNRCIPLWDNIHHTSLLQSQTEYCKAPNPSLWLIA